MLHGIDISHHQSNINIDNVDFDFCIVKATQGVSYRDNCFSMFADKVLAKNKLLGIYHYFGGNDPLLEADHFCNVIKQYVGKAILVLDWEGAQNKMFSKGQTIAKPFLDAVYERTGVRPMIYMSKSVCRSYDWSEVVKSNYGLWVAQYADSNPTGYKAQPWTDSKGLGAFPSYAIFQYSSHGRLEGYSGNLDLDIAYMTKEAWYKYAGKSAAEDVEYYTSPEFTLIDSLNKIGVDSSYHHRYKIAMANGIKNYCGTAEQNIELLYLLNSGKLIKP